MGMGFNVVTLFTGGLVFRGSKRGLCLKAIGHGIDD